MDIFLGYMFIIIASVCCGAYAFPHKFVRTLKWETLWPVCFFFAQVGIPFLMVKFLLPGVSIWRIFKEAGPAPIIIAATFGLTWGIGCVTFSLGITALGLALGYSLIFGVNTAVGSLIPLFTTESIVVGSNIFYLTIAGMTICIIGVALSGYGGVLRERSIPAKTEKETSHKSDRKTNIVYGIIMCIIAGAFSAGGALAFHFGLPIGEVAKKYVENPTLATVPVWLPIMPAAFSVVLVCSLVTMIRNKTYKTYLQEGSVRDIGLGFIMGFLLYAGMITTGFGLARLSVAIGWGINMGFTILTALVLGILTGEWKGAPLKAIMWMTLGVVVIVTAFVVLGYGKSLAG